MCGILKQISIYLMAFAFKQSYENMQVGKGVNMLSRRWDDDDRL